MKEEFVTYDLAIKLKEKGFLEHVRGHYKSKCHLSVCSEPMNCNGSASGDISAPQIHEVLKWLREKKNIEVVASFSYRNKVWGYQVGDMTLLEDSILSYDYSFPTYEEAALAGVNYCLDNLI